MTADVELGQRATDAKPSVALGLSRSQWAAIVIPALACLALCVYQLQLPNVLVGIHSYSGGGYDDGVHIATALRLTGRSFPYADYVFLHPPGIAVFLYPLAVIGRLTSEQDALILGRILMTLISVANVVLISALLRRRGTVAMLFGGMFLALWPLSVDATRTIMLEPVMVLFMLLGALLMFPQGRFATGNRIMNAGLFFGFALSVKMLAVMPIAAIVVLALVKWRVRIKPLVIGVALGFSVIVLPFFLMAPGKFFDQVVVSQLTRHPATSFAKPAAERLAMILGLSSQPTPSQGSLAVVISCVLAVLVAFTYAVQRRRLRDLDWFALIAAAFVILGMFRAPDLFEHYLYLSAAFLALLFGTTLGLLLELIPERVGPDGVSARWLTSCAVAAIVMVLSVPLFRHDQTVSKIFISSADDPSEWIASFIPKGSCVVSDVSTLPVIADRYQTDDPNCPTPVDPFGMWLAQPSRKSPNQDDSASPELIATWRDYLERSDYVVMSVDYTNFFPWPQQQQQWFANNFRKVGTRGQVVVYERVRNG
ncbi:MAG: hypothetical protein WCJ88_10635 [Actinomycetes bacterium]